MYGATINIHTECVWNITFN